MDHESPEQKAVGPRQSCERWEAWASPLPSHEEAAVRKPEEADRETCRRSSMVPGSGEGAPGP